MKKIGLRAYLLNELMKEGYLSLDKVHGLTRSFGAKERTAERQLNKGISPMVETIYNEKKCIVGYKYKYWKPAEEKSEVKEMTMSML